MPVEELTVELVSKVRVSVGLTIQIAPYNTARVQLDIEEECEAPTDEVLDRLYMQLEGTLVDKIQHLRERTYEEGLIR